MRKKLFSKLACGGNIFYVRLSCGGADRLSPAALFVFPVRKQERRAQRRGEKFRAGKESQAPVTPHSAEKANAAGRRRRKPRRKVRSCAGRARSPAAKKLHSTILNPAKGAAMKYRRRPGTAMDCMSASPSLLKMRAMGDAQAATAAATAIAKASANVAAQTRRRREVSASSSPWARLNSGCTPVQGR